MKDFIFETKNGITFGSFPLLSENGFINGCSCRTGGESDIVEGSLNLALHVGDDPKKVLKNRRSYSKALGVNAEHFTTCEQVHGTVVARVESDMIGSGALDYANTVMGVDALVTALPGVPLLLFYADCVPVILADSLTGAVGLVHAGWRGTTGGIVTRAVASMQELRGVCAKNILAAIGPSIGVCCYEVDELVRDRTPAGYERFFRPVHEKTGKYMLDLWGYNRQLLLETGVLPENIAVAGFCTAENNNLFYSYREEQGKTGRMGVCIQSDLCR